MMMSFPLEENDIIIDIKFKGKRESKILQVNILKSPALWCYKGDTTLLNLKNFYQEMRSVDAEAKQCCLSKSKRQKAKRKSIDLSLRLKSRPRFERKFVS